MPACMISLCGREPCLDIGVDSDEPRVAFNLTLLEHIGGNRKGAE